MHTMLVADEISSKFSVTIRGCGLCQFARAWAMAWPTRATIKRVELTLRTLQNLCCIK